MLCRLVDLSEAESTLSRRRNRETRSPLLNPSRRKKAEIDLIVLQAVVRGLNAHAIAGENQAFFGLHPNGNRKHAAKSREAIHTPAAKGVKHNLSVTVCFKD